MYLLLLCFLLNRFIEYGSIREGEQAIRKFDRLTLGESFMLRVSFALTGEEKLQRKKEREVCICQRLKPLKGRPFCG